MPAGNTYVPIATTTLGSSAGSVSFTSIPSTYTDLVIVCSYLGASGVTSVFTRVNNDSASNYSSTVLAGNGTGATSGRFTNQTEAYQGWYGTGSNGWANSLLNFQNYANTTTNKTWLTRMNRADGEVDAGVSLWRSTSAINRIDVYGTGSGFATGSQFSLYGIASA